MAIFTRTNGDANGVVNVDTGVNGGGIGAIVSTGIGKHPTMFVVTNDTTLVGETGTGGNVEVILRTIAERATPIAYQVENDTSGEVRVLVESTGWADDAAVQAAVRAAIGSPGATVASTAGLAG